MSLIIFRQGKFYGVMDTDKNDLIVIPPKYEAIDLYYPEDHYDFEYFFIAIDAELNVLIFNRLGQTIGTCADSHYCLLSENGIYYTAKNIPKAVRFDTDTIIRSSNGILVSISHDHNGYDIFVPDYSTGTWVKAFENCFGCREQSYGIIVTQNPDDSTYSVVSNHGILKDLPISLTIDKGRHCSSDRRELMATQHGKTGLIDMKTGQWVIQPYENGGNFYGVINEYGDRIQFDIYDGSYYVNGEKRLTLFGGQGIDCVEQARYYALKGFLKARYGKSCVFINMNNHTISKYYNASSDFPGSISIRFINIVGQNGKYGLMDNNFKELYPTEYDCKILEDGKISFSDLFASDRVRLVKDGKYGFGNLEGKIIVNCIWDSLSLYDNGNSNYMQVALDNKIGAMTQDGRITIAPEWDEVVNGFQPDKIILLRYTDNGRKIYGLINFMTGKTILEEEFDNVVCFSSRVQYFVTQKNGMTGLYNVKKGCYEIEPQICNIEYNDFVFTITKPDEIIKIEL